jgi:hypothetical protein
LFAEGDDVSIIEINIVIEDVENISILYDRVQLFRSASQSGSFSALTDDIATPAILDGTVDGPWNLVGQSLSIALDSSDPITVSFTGSNPFDLSTVLNQINGAFQALPTLLAVEVPTDTDRVRLRSASAGTQSILEVTGTAVTTLGLSTVKANGKGASPLISPNTEIYTILDFDGLDSYWYKARYINAETGAASDLSEAFPGGDGVGIPDSNLCTGKIALSDMSGHPIVDRRIIFVPTGPQVISDGIGNNYGVLPSVDRITVVTDFNGRATVKLVKGQQLKVFIEGTTFQREFIVPTVDFDILTVASVQPDPLSIVTTAPLAIRVS